MTTPDLPGNSKSTRPQGEKVEPVVTGEVLKRPKSLGRRLKEFFIGGDSKTAMEHVFKEVIVPQAKELFTEAVTRGVEQMLYGESRPSGRRNRSVGRTDYNAPYSSRNTPAGRAERDGRGAARARDRYNLEDIVLDKRIEGDTILERMYDMLAKYGSVTVADLYSMVGWTPEYMDQKWGWVDLGGSRVRTVRDGFLLELPNPQQVD